MKVLHARAIVGRMRPPGRVALGTPAALTARAPVATPSQERPVIHTTAALGARGALLPNLSRPRAAPVAPPREWPSHLRQPAATLLDPTGSSARLRWQEVTGSTGMVLPYRQAEVSSLVALLPREDGVSF